MFKFWRERNEAIRKAVTEERKKIISEHAIELTLLMQENRKKFIEQEKAHDQEIKEIEEKAKQSYETEVAKKVEIINRLQRDISKAEIAWKHINRYGKILAEYADNYYTEEQINIKRFSEQVSRAGKQKDEIEMIMREIKLAEKEIIKLIPGIS